MAEGELEVDKNINIYIVSSKIKYYKRKEMCNNKKKINKKGNVNKNK